MACSIMSGTKTFEPEMSLSESIMHGYTKLSDHVFKALKNEMV